MGGARLGLGVDSVRDRSGIIRVLGPVLELKCSLSRQNACEHFAVRESQNEEESLVTNSEAI